jgi:hypothetical protein
LLLLQVVLQVALIQIVLGRRHVLRHKHALLMGEAIEVGS